ncbi:unnamed protein product [Blepharisma stoltei]|uniref:Uncharacterized protein n=1 Tax=Blepharisma stoltei TaxID=1481888 RepID=A0AAU9IFD2_9CILI|nr:unnamed protein product [Blepharisma stoltei]
MERESVFAPSTEVKNYDIQDIYDLEDCLDIFESIVQDLKIPNKKKSEISELMAKYVYMEDSVLEGLEKLPKVAKTDKMQKRLLDDMQKFNELSCDFQDSWNNEYWSVYELTREGYDSNSMKNQEQVPGKTIKQISQQLYDLQDMALVLSRMSRGPEDSKDIHGCQSLAAIDEEAQKYKEPTIKKQANKRNCEQCILY